MIGLKIEYIYTRLAILCSLGIDHWQLLDINTLVHSCIQHWHEYQEGKELDSIRSNLCNVSAFNQIQVHVSLGQGGVQFKSHWKITAGLVSGLCWDIPKYVSSFVGFVVCSVGLSYLILFLHPLQVYFLLSL